MSSLQNDGVFHMHCVCTCVHLYDGFFYSSIVCDRVMVSGLFRCCSSFKCCLMIVLCQDGTFTMCMLLLIVLQVIVYDRLSPFDDYIVLLFSR